MPLSGGSGTESMAEFKVPWAPIETAEAEARMRQALDRLSGASKTVGAAGPPIVHSSNPRPAHRSFAKDGDVAVERRALVDGGANLRADVVDALRSEHETRQRLGGELAAALQKVEDLKTRLAHQEISLQEALAGRVAAERALADLTVREQPQPTQADPQPAAAIVPRRPRGRPPKYPRAPVGDQEPIWSEAWIKS